MAQSASWLAAGHPGCRERLPVGAGRQRRPPGQVRALHLRGDDRIIHPRSGPAPLQRHVLADHAHTGLATGLVLPCIGFGIEHHRAGRAQRAGQASTPTPARAARSSAPDPARRTETLAGGRPRTRILLLPVGLPPLLLLLLIPVPDARSPALPSGRAGRRHASARVRRVRATTHADYARRGIAGSIDRNAAIVAFDDDIRTPGATLTRPPSRAAPADRKATLRCVQARSKTGGGAPLPGQGIQRFQRTGDQVGRVAAGPNRVRLTTRLPDRSK